MTLPEPEIRAPGGSFAPEITAETIAKYKAIAPDPTTQVGDHFASLLTMVETFIQTPPSSLPAIGPHPSGFGKAAIVPLAEDEKRRIWDVVPWEDELNAIAAVFAKLPPGGHFVADDTAPKKRRFVVTDQAAFELRGAAHHLLWYGFELTYDREPITKERAVS